MQNIMNYDYCLEEEVENIKPINLREAKIDTQYIIKNIDSDDLELKNFLFTLGCYEGEEITLISKLAGNFVINIKDARYSIDEELAKAILLK
ncbi:MAG: ferrous iron transport protein A [Clostridia bacterium]